MDYQVIVIGAGPGGYPAALKASRMGARVCIVEAKQVGGTCLNRGCIPTKALVESASALRRARKAGEFGVDVGEPALNYVRVRSRQEEIVTRLRSGVQLLLQNSKIELVQAHGRLAGSNQVDLVYDGGRTERITGDKIIVATGSEPLLPQSLGYDGDVVLSSTEMLQLGRTSRDPADRRRGRDRLRVCRDLRCHGRPGDPGGGPADRSPVYRRGPGPEAAGDAEAAGDRPEDQDQDPGGGPGRAGAPGSR